MHLDVGIVRRRVFNHRDFIAQFKGKANRCLHTRVCNQSNSNRSQEASPKSLDREVLSKLQCWVHLVAPERL